MKLSPAKNFEKQVELRSRRLLTSILTVPLPSTYPPCTVPATATGLWLPCQKCAYIKRCLGIFLNVQFLFYKSPTIANNNIDRAVMSHKRLINSFILDGNSYGQRWTTVHALSNCSGAPLSGILPYWLLNDFCHFNSAGILLRTQVFLLLRKTTPCLEIHPSISISKAALLSLKSKW